MASTSNFKAVVHVGWVADIRSVRDALLPLLPETHREKIGKYIDSECIFTAVHHLAPANTMRSWYNKNSKKPNTGYIKSFYVCNKMMVAKIIIDMKPYYLVLSKSSQQQNAYRLKIAASSGDLGPEIEIQRIEFGCVAYAC
jgi:hypothetical protein